jgi:hypothetical protein
MAKVTENAPGAADLIGCAERSARQAAAPMGVIGAGRRWPVVPWPDRPWRGLMKGRATYRGRLNIANSVAMAASHLAGQFSGRGATGLRLRRFRRGLRARRR